MKLNKRILRRLIIEAILNETTLEPEPIGKFSNRKEFMEALKKAAEKSGFITYSSPYDSKKEQKLNLNFRNKSNSSFETVSPEMKDRTTAFLSKDKDRFVKELTKADSRLGPTLRDPNIRIVVIEDGYGGVSFQIETRLTGERFNRI